MKKTLVNFTLFATLAVSAWGAKVGIENFAPELTFPLAVTFGVGAFILWTNANKAINKKYA
ncbi:hypothetical protein [Paenibacillus amylolyticus]|uniref:hypothetical protein n=1 Tax=Paenibacillus amylolyticus TaxID=1451 RepID=UPI000B815D7A|nr:hypothetical protein [Paenibacillus amylolyticus]